ncbi:MAG: hypothetical protein AB3N23_20470 [Paracoccaceae bacterium]
MTDSPQETDAAHPTPLGIYDRPRRPNVTGIEIAAAVLTLVWLGLSVGLFVLMPDYADENFDGLRFVGTMLAIFMPVAMIWVAATAARSSRVIREESQRLQTAIDAIRHAYVAQSQRAVVTQAPSVTKKLDEIAEATRKTETALATFQTRRDQTRPRPATDTEDQQPTAEGQGRLELGTPAEELSPPVSHEDLIRALHFPETVEDEAGFAALRRALKDRRTAQLINAAQDVLTLLSQDGIYMDDLRPDLARPEIWRSFAAGTRGRSVAALGGVRDRSSLALTATRMKQDPIFRDAAHHFLRKFDGMLLDFEPEASDAELTALSDTRTARAFMLLGRVTGTFS